MSESGIGLKVSISGGGRTTQKSGSMSYGVTTEPQFWSNDFMETLEAITTFNISSDFSFYHLSEQSSSLKPCQILVFPVFLALTPRTDCRF